MGASSPHRMAAIVVGALVFVGGYLVFPVESDAGYVINDALWNGSGPELRPWREISAHHPGQRKARYLAALLVIRTDAVELPVVGNPAGARKRQLLGKITVREKGTNGQIPNTHLGGFIQQPQRLLVNVLAGVKPFGIGRRLAAILFHLARCQAGGVFCFWRVQGIEGGR